MIGEVYKRDRGEARDLERHKSMETTREAYSHLDAEEQRERLDELVEEFYCSSASSKSRTFPTFAPTACRLTPRISAHSCCVNAPCVSSVSSTAQ
jgi:hypothetical protein